MGYRRSPDRIDAARAWSHFVDRNRAVIAAAGIPPAVTESVADWDHFLVHGHRIGDRGFTVDQLTPEQYVSLVELAHNYFAAGYEFYAPLALRADDQAMLHARFGGE